MKNIVCSFIVFLMVMSSCLLPDRILFPIEETIVPDLMPLQGLTVPYRIDIKHPFLILQNRETIKDSLFHIYNIEKGELVTVFGSIGQGPKEFTLPTMIPTTFSYLIVKDRQSFRKIIIDEEGIASFDETMEPLYNYNISQAAFINDSLFVVDAMYTGPFVNLCSINNEIPKRQWKYRNPEIMDVYMDINKGEVYANDSRIIFCYGVKKQIDFMDTEFNLVRRVKFDGYDVPLEINKNPDEERNSYVCAYLGKRYLYAMFLGTTWGEHKKRSTCGYCIEVFDLNGNPIARYQMNGRRPLFFAVDEKTFTLYGPGCQGDPEDHLLVYKLKGLE